MCLPGTIEVVREEIESEREAAPSNGLTRRATLAGAGAAALGAFLPAGAMAHSKDGHHTLNGERAARASLGSHFHDLTHVFTAGFPVYTGDPPTRSTLVTVENDGFYAQEWTFEEHTGTHMDAPGHFVADGRRVPALRPEELFAPVAVIDISARAASDPDAEVEVRDLRRFERRYGRIPYGAIVCMYSGWEARLPDPVEWLLERRNITGIGVDTLSLDPGNSTTFAVHTRLLGADRYGLENVANLAGLPARGAQVTVGVIPWEEGSGGPCRLLATY